MSLKKNILIIVVTAMLMLKCSVTLSQTQESEGGSFSILDLPGSSTTWSDPSNASVDDGLCTSTDYIDHNGEYSNYLVATNFSFNIPSDKIITGIEIIFEKESENLSKTHDYSVRIVKNGVLGSTELKKECSWEGQGDPVMYGGEEDLFGETWTPEEINLNNFGIAISAMRLGEGGADFKARIDNIKILIHYAEPMPVEFLGLELVKEKKKIQINWSTASETNNNFFTVERSENGTVFTTIATIKGAGNSNSVITYNYIDNTPVKGVSYYRIKQTDFDGKYDYSEIKAISFVNTISDFMIYPNPVKSGSTVHIVPNNDIMRDYVISVYLINGQKIAEYKANGIFSINTDEIQKGIYILNVFDGTQNINNKIVIE